MEIIDAVDGTRAVDHQRLHQRRAVGDQLRLEKFLHQRQHAGHRRGRDARAGFVTVPVRLADRVVEIAQDLEIISQVVRRHHRHLQIKLHRPVGGIADAEIINRAVHQRRIRRQRHRVDAHEIVRRRHVVLFHVNRQVAHRYRVNPRGRDGQPHRVVRHKHGRENFQPVGRHRLVFIRDGVVVGGVVIGQLIPLLRTRRNHERARRDHVRFEPSEIPLNPDADVAAR